MTVTPWGAVIRLMRPAATELRTNRTQRAAGRSPVKRPLPATSAGSSTRRIERPPQPRPSTFFTSTAIGPALRSRLLLVRAELGGGGLGERAVDHARQRYVLLHQPDLLEIVEVRLQGRHVERTVRIDIGRHGVTKD